MLERKTKSAPRKFALLENGINHEEKVHFSGLNLKSFENKLTFVTNFAKGGVDLLVCDLDVK